MNILEQMQEELLIESIKLVRLISTLQDPVQLDDLYKHLRDDVANTSGFGVLSDDGKELTRQYVDNELTRLGLSPINPTKLKDGRVTREEYKKKVEFILQAYLPIPKAPIKNVQSDFYARKFGKF